MTPHEKRAARDRERRAAKKADEEAWKAQVEAHFGYLREHYGFALTRVSSSVWQTSPEYSTERTEVDVTRSFEFGEVDVWLQRKPDWILPGQPVYATMNLTHEKVYVGLLVRLRASHLQPELAATIGLSNDVIEKRLVLCAQILREYGDYLLRGDFSQLGA